MLIKKLYIYIYISSSHQASLVFCLELPLTGYGTEISLPSRLMIPVKQTEKATSSGPVFSPLQFLQNYLLDTYPVTKHNI